MPKSSTSESTTRIVVTLPNETKEEIYSYAESIGMKPTYFCASALVLGYRELMKTYSPKLYWTEKGNMSDEEWRDYQEALTEMHREHAEEMDLLEAVRSIPKERRQELLALFRD